MDTFRALPNGANAAYYRQVALSDEEVAAAEVVSRPRGVGSVNVVVSAQGGLPDAQLLERLKQMDPAALQSAVNMAFRGNQEGARDALSPLLSDPEVQRLSKQMRDGHGGV